MTEQQDVLFEEIPGKDGNLGLITLNRPDVLNSLNLIMIQSMQKQLNAWAGNDSIKGVVIQGKGRAFCAGGDLRLTYERHQKNDDQLALFFHDEYQLNKTIYHYPKPYIALLDGITMGGGVGVSIHGSHRVATENLVFAMPETGIGYFPDVGGTHFLPRLPGHIGLYLGLSGARLRVDDCKALNLVQHKVTRDDFPAIFEALAKHSWGNDPQTTVQHILAKFHIASDATSLLQQQESIDKCFAFSTVEDILDALQLSTNAVCQDAAIAFTKKSPTSLKVTLAALKRSAKLDFDECMRQEFRLASHFLSNHDFFEGIRALIVDKDQKPHWQPAILSNVTQEKVESYFSPLKEELM